MGGPGSGPRGQHISDWDDRRPEIARKITEAAAAIPRPVLSRAMAAYEDAPLGTGLENRMLLAIHSVMRSKPRNPAPPDQDGVPLA